MDPIILLVICFVIFLLLNVPVAYSIASSTMIAMMYDYLSTSTDVGIALQTIAQKMATGINNFSLLAIPFFILSGIFMGRGGLAKRLIDFAEALVGRFKGGLAFVNVLTCMFFGAISGSAAAAVSSVGGFMMPIMKEKGYDKNFNTAVTVTAATTGLLIPPSNVMIIYTVAVVGVSVKAIFIAGIIPGVLVGFALMFVAGIISHKHNYGKGQVISFKEGTMRFLRALPSLLLIIIIMGGILGGIFTATEASAIAVVYAFFLSVVCYKEVKLNEIPNILLQCAKISAIVLMLIATSSAMSSMLNMNNVPIKISDFLLKLTENKILILLIINMLLLAVGTFMDMTPAILIFTPILLPVVEKFGMSPLHFGIILIMNLCIGLCTPPVGTCLFLGCGIGETTVSKVMRHIIWFYIAMIAVLLLCTFVPALTEFLPHFFE